MRGKKYWIAWSKAAGIRAVKTMAQGALAMLPAAATIGEVNHHFLLSKYILTL